MDWKYEIIEHEGGYQLVEKYDEDSHAVLDGRYELWSETKEGLIERLKLMLSDLEIIIDKNE
jgi:hypothetical protein